jgi:hypothetical protein
MQSAISRRSRSTMSEIDTGPRAIASLAGCRPAALPLISNRNDWNNQDDQLRPNNSMPKIRDRHPAGRDAEHRRFAIGVTREHADHRTGAPDGRVFSSISGRPLAFAVGATLKWQSGEEAVSP